ncbi:MAG: ABC transporter permease [Ardenticatenales bacterium]|jgi:fluoroquinolone transport system permease protein|nr:ABC transporter permease [Ardenticatenales bacterium]
MRRLLAATRHDVRLQVRGGFYAAAAFVALCMIPLLRLLPAATLTTVLPSLVLLNMQVNTFYFIGGLVLLEKAEGSLQALAVSPLRPWEYIAAKVASLALLSTLEAGAIVLATHGPRFDALFFAAGVGLTAVLFALYGFVAVARYSSINAFLFPSLVYTAVLGLPVFDVLGIWPHPAWLLHPVRAPLVLLEAAFRPEPAWRIGYAIGYGALSSVALGWFALRAYERHVVARGGDA